MNKVYEVSRWRCCEPLNWIPMKTDILCSSFHILFLSSVFLHSFRCAFISQSHTNHFSFWWNENIVWYNYIVLSRCMSSRISHSVLYFPSPSIILLLVEDLANVEIAFIIFIWNGIHWMLPFSIVNSVVVIIGICISLRLRKTYSTLNAVTTININFCLKKKSFSSVHLCVSIFWIEPIATQFIVCMCVDNLALSKHTNPSARRISVCMWVCVCIFLWFIWFEMKSLIT